MWRGSNPSPTLPLKGRVEFVVALFQRLARFNQLLVDEQALIQIRLALGIQIRQRTVAGFKLLRDFRLARFQLRKLTMHALQRLLQRRNG